MGSTLTLSREDGNYLISFTAFFIGLVSTRFWRIICFILHNSFSTSTPRDALHHQQQAILRNSGSVDSGLFIFLQLAWAWRKNTKRIFVRVWPVIATATFLTVAFTIAGGFSSSISTGIGNDVLLDGSNCAFVNTQFADNEALNLLQPYISRQSNNAANYAQQCYGTNTSGMFDCGTVVKARIPSYVDNQTACPFAEGLCQSNANIRIDTGYIDSHEHLGLNAPSNERVIFRTVLQCAPLVTEGYTSSISTSSENYTLYNYGPRNPQQNYTFKTSNSDTQYQYKGNEFKLRYDNLISCVPALSCIFGCSADYRTNHSSYLSYVFNGTRGPVSSDFIPTPGLFPTEGDLVLTFLSANGVEFLERTDDPWYRGNVPGANMTWSRGSNISWNGMTYRMDEAASPMGCLQQFQFCNPAFPEGGRCGPLASLLDAQLLAAHLFNITYEQLRSLTHEQMVESGILETPAAARYIWLLMFLTAAVPSWVTLINVLGPNSLASQQSLTRASSVLGTIPSNQWQLDVKNWWAIYMASLQAGIVNTAYGSHDPTLKPYEIPPLNSHVQRMCNNQVSNIGACIEVASDFDLLLPCIHCLNFLLG